MRQGLDTIDNVATVGTSGLVHDAFVYSSEDEFLAGALPFVEEGIDRGEPILAAPTRSNAELLQKRLGQRASAVDWAEDAESHRTVERLKIFLDYIDRHVDGGATRIRLLGEPCWPKSGGPGVAEWKRYESFLNLALAPHPVWLVCPYDNALLQPDIVADACLTHPIIGYGEDRKPCGEYLEPAAFARRIDGVRLPQPPQNAGEGYFESATATRRFVAGRAAEAGLRDERLKDAELAASEIAANVFQHAADVARVRAWTSNGSFTFDIDDTGLGISDPFAGYSLPEPTAQTGRGLAMARRLADVVEIRTTATGALVRLHFSLPVATQ
jgi:anti-sigma regulatory factor (Ser/Thr protein kinase)